MEKISFIWSTAKPLKFFVCTRDRRAFRVKGMIDYHKRLIEIQTHRKEFELHVLMELVPGYGSVWCIADNDAQGYKCMDNEFELVRELAETRIRRVRERGKTVCATKDLIDLEGAQSFLDEAKKKKGLVAEKLAYQALSKAMICGEDMELGCAEKKLESKKSEDRKGFVAGTLFGERSGQWAIGVGPDWPADQRPDFLRPEKDRQLILQLIDSTTLPNFWRYLEYEKGKYNWTLVDQILEISQNEGLICKSFALVWPSQTGLPPWFRHLNFSGQLKAIEQWVKVVVERYRDEVACWETVNEMHDSTGNSLNWSHKQILGIVRLVHDIVGALDPGEPRIPNHNMIEGYYVQHNDPLRVTILDRLREEKEDMWSPLSFLDRVRQEGIEFEGVGLQTYVPKYDVMEALQWIDVFAYFSPVWITELAYPTAIFKDDDIETGQVIASERDAWRHRWSEHVQAEWLRYWYTCYAARDSIKSINYWDLTDEQSFVPSCGIIAKGQPKPGYQAIRSFCENYQVGAGSIHVR